MRGQLRDGTEKPNTGPTRELGGGGGTSEEPKPQKRLEELASKRERGRPKLWGEPSGWDVPEQASAAARPDEDLQARLDKLQDAANAASGHVRNVYVTFLLFGLYLAIILGSTTHEQLLRETPVTLPLLDVGLPLGGFYWVAPALFVLLHLNLLLQLYFLAEKLYRVDRVIGPRRRDGWANDQRAKLHPFPFSYLLAGRQHAGLTRMFLVLIVWIAVVILPVLVLLFGQLRFLPYHGQWTTWWHRLLIVADLALIWTLWPGTLEFGGSLARRLPATAQQCLSVLRPKRWGKIWRNSRRKRHRRRQLKIVLDPRAQTLRALAAGALGLAFFVLAIPGLPTAFLVDLLGGERARLIIFPRNLELREADLVVSQPDAAFSEGKDEVAVLKYVRGLDLRGRDLRHANLALTDLRKVDLRGADLQGADLEDADLQSADLDDADLQGAYLQYADLQGAYLGRADLQGSVLQYADLRGAYLQDADLQGADLRDADLQGAYLQYADLQGAQLFRADLRSTKLRGADLQGAVLLSADLQSADLRGAHLWRGLVDDQPELVERWQLADLREVRVEPVEEGDEPRVIKSMEDIERFIDGVLREIGHEGAREVAGRLLREGLIDHERPAIPQLPFGLSAGILFDPASPLAEDRGWGVPMSIVEYDRQLAEEVLIPLACAPDAPPAIVGTTALRAVREPEKGRLYAGLVAKALLGDACPPAKELPDSLVDLLRDVLGGHLVAQMQGLEQGLAAPSP